MIGVIDYGIVNTGSVIRMIERAGGRACRVLTADEMRSVDKLVLPGVGHFDQGISLLNDQGISAVLREQVLEKKIPLLGICLGMQLLCARSEEGILPGLGFVDAEVKRLTPGVQSGLKVPHMGWNDVKVQRANPLLSPLNLNQRFYFVHSYFVRPQDPSIVIASTQYGVDFCSAFQADNIFGVQFHPEKSHRFGMMLMKSFLDL